MRRESTGTQAKQIPPKKKKKKQKATTTIPTKRHKEDVKVTDDERIMQNRYNKENVWNLHISYAQTQPGSKRL